MTINNAEAEKRVQDFLDLIALNNGGDAGMDELVKKMSQRYPEIYIAWQDFMTMLTIMVGLKTTTIEEAFKSAQSVIDTCCSDAALQLLEEEVKKGRKEIQLHPERQPEIAERLTNLLKGLKTKEKEESPKRPPFILPSSKIVH